jgi:hypothetical protein
LPRDVAELSRLLTKGREDRSESYLGRPNLLSAYLRYFLPWNVYRLCRLLPALPLALADGDAVTDIGSGPCTLAIALWISRPDLRNLHLEFRCLDRTAAVMDAGKRIFATLVSGPPGGTGASLWTIKTIKGELRRTGTLSARIQGRPAKLVTAVNTFNELFWALSPVDTRGLRRTADQSARLLGSLTGESGSVLVMEPGIPRCGEFISVLRAALMEQGLFPLSPCFHCEACPFPGGFSSKGGKARWCHFAFDTEDAPGELLRLSRAAGIPKERAVLSFILADKQGPAPESGIFRPETPGTPKAVPGAAGNNTTAVLVLSDSFAIGKEGRYGRYCCSPKGLVLAAGSGKTISQALPGSFLRLALSRDRDPKSGALLGEVPASVIPQPN